jgi:hypothetical protein
MTVEEAREAFRRLPSNGAIAARDYPVAEEILQSARLIKREGEVVQVVEATLALAGVRRELASDLLVALLLERDPPQWLTSAAGGRRLNHALVPDPEIASLTNIIEDPAILEAVLLRAARHYDAEQFALLTDVGDTHVLEHCRAELASEGAVELADAVTRISAISKRLSYDIDAPRLDGASRRLEVKTTRRHAWRGEVFLSRAEYDYGLADRSWALVVVEIDRDGTPAIIGWCRAADLEPMIPDDRAHGRWDRVRILQTEGLLMPGVPPAA